MEYLHFDYCKDPQQAPLWHSQQAAPPIPKLEMSRQSLHLRELQPCPDEELHSHEGFRDTLSSFIWEDCTLAVPSFAPASLNAEVLGCVFNGGCIAESIDFIVAFLRQGQVEFPRLSQGSLCEESTASVDLQPPRLCPECFAIIFGQRRSLNSTKSRRVRTPSPEFMTQQHCFRTSKTQQVLVRARDSEFHLTLKGVDSEREQQIPDTIGSVIGFCQLEIFLRET